MTLTIPTDRAFRTPGELRRLVEAVRDASNSALETDWLDWKLGEKAGQQDFFGDAGRYIIGFANRHPDHARQVAEGCSYLLVGVEPGKVTGAPVHDSADLLQGIERYVGADGPRWSPYYIQVEAAEVLVILIEAPRWGDQIHCLRREYAKYKAGAVFVRKNGKTEQQDVASLRMLEERLLRRGDVLDVAVEWADGNVPVVQWIRLGEADVEGWVNGEREELLASARRYPDTRHVGGAFDGFVMNVAHLWGETRSHQHYRQEVERYLGAAREHVLGRARALLVQDFATPSILVLVNSSDRFRQAVRLEIQLPSGIRAYHRRIDAMGDTGMPEPPKPYGSGHGLGFALPHRPPRPPVRISNEGGCRLLFDPVDLRAEARVELPRFYLVAEEVLADQTVDGQWSATSVNGTGRVRGTITVHVSADAVDASKLLDRKFDLHDD